MTTPLSAFWRLAVLQAVCVVAVVFYGRPALAQHDTTDASGRTLVVWTAVGRDQPLKTRMGQTNDRDLYVVGLRARWLLLSESRIALLYTADILPAVVSTSMPGYKYTSPPCPSPWQCVVPASLTQEMTRQDAYGAGLVPVGLELRFRAARRVALLARGSAGIVYFSRPVPDPDERRLNLMFDTGVAGEVDVGQRLALTVGYRINHISNAGRGPVNPGMNSRMLEIGLVFAR